MDVALGSVDRAVDLGTLFARSARVALAGLVGPPVLLSLASAAGYPLRTGVESVTWLGALLGFAGAGWMASRGAPPGRWNRGVLVAGFLAAGIGVTPAFRGLQGLVGREHVGVVFAVTLGAFAAGFGLGGAMAARGLGLAGTARLARIGAASAVAGAAGGALALLPYAWSLLDFRFPGDTYVWMAFTVIAFLGCIIVPFYWMGAIIAREIGDGAAMKE